MSEATHLINTTDATRPLISMEAGQPVVDSLHIAKQFDRPHKTVLAAIDLLIERRPDQLGQNFLPKSGSASTGNGGVRGTRGFLMTRDGFALLIMGFTGEKALKWKLDYLAAFNLMEAELRKRQAPALDVRDVGQLQAITLQLIQVNQEQAAELAGTRQDLVVAKEEIEAAKPMIDAYLQFLDDDGLCHLSTAARVIGAPHNLFFEWLRERRYCFDADGFLQPRADLRKDGHLTIRLKPNGYHGRSPQTMCTRSGLAWLRQRWAIGPGKTIALQAAVASRQASLDL